MKRWFALLLSVALLGAPCLTAGAAGIAEVKEDFERYKSTDEVKSNNWFFDEGVVDANRGIKSGSITLEPTTGMDGVPTQVVNLTNNRVEGVSTQRDVYFQKDGVDFTGEMVTAFRMRIGEDADFRQVLCREVTSAGTSFIDIMNMYGQKLVCFKQDVMDPETGEPMLLDTGKWYDIAIVSTQTVGSLDIPYKLYINGDLIVENTYTADDKPRTFVSTIRFDHRFDNNTVSSYDTMTTEFDDILITKRSALSFDNMASTPQNGNVSVPAKDGVIQVDFGTRMDTSTITKDQLTLTQYFEGETTEITDYELAASAYGMTLTMPDGTFAEEASYTLTIGDVYDFQGNILPGDKREISFETVGEPYVLDYFTEELVATDFNAFTGTPVSPVGGVPNQGAIAAEQIDDSRLTSCKLTLDVNSTNSCPWVGIDVPGGLVPNSGIVILQADFLLTAKDHIAQIFTIKDSGGRWNTDLNFYSNGALCLMNGNTVVKKLMDYDINTWYTVREEINLDTKTIDVYVNGQLIAQGENLQNQQTADVPSVRVTLVNPSSNPGSVYIDNFSVGTQKEVPGVMKVKFLDSSGILRSSQAPQDTVEVQLLFSMPMKQETLTAENIQLKRSAAGLPVPCSLDYDSDTHTVSLRPEDPLVMNMDYRVELAEAVQATNNVSVGSGKAAVFESAAGDFGRVHLAVLNAADEEIASVADLTGGDAVRGQAQLQNATGSRQEAVLVFAWYQGDILKAARLVPVALETNSSETFTTDAITVNEVEGSTLRVFVWNGESGKQAVCEPLTVQ